LKVRESCSARFCHGLHRALMLQHAAPSLRIARSFSTAGNPAKQIAELPSGQPLEAAVAKKKRPKVSPVLLEAQLALVAAARCLTWAALEERRPAPGILRQRCPWPSVSLH